MTKEQIDVAVQYWRDHSTVNRHDGAVIVALADQRDELVALLRKCVRRLDYADQTLREENNGPYDEEATFAADICDIHALLAKIGVTK